MFLFRRWALACVVLLVWATPGTAHADFSAAEQALAAGQLDRVLAELGPLVQQGDARALNLLAVLTQNGWGLERDPTEAVGLYRRAADAGLTRAIHNLGRMYRAGLGVARDDAETARLWKIAARQGSVASQASLGNLYFIGEGVPRDVFRAYFWWTIAARHFDLEAVRAREDIIYMLTPHQKEVADRLAAQFLNDD